MAAGFLAAAFPDSDFVLRSIDPLTYLDWHQSVTHSVLLLPFWAFLLAHLFFRLTGRRYSWRAFFGPALLGIAIHIAGDVITAYGPMLLAPISSQRFSLPLAFVIDAYFSAIVAAGLATAIFPPRKRHASVVALIMLGCYVAFQEKTGAGIRRFSDFRTAPRRRSSRPWPCCPHAPDGDGRLNRMPAESALDISGLL